MKRFATLLAAASLGAALLASGPAMAFRGGGFGGFLSLSILRLWLRLSLWLCLRARLPLRARLCLRARLRRRASRYRAERGTLAVQALRHGPECGTQALAVLAGLCEAA
jgi:hypothetical protein